MNNKSEEVTLEYYLKPAMNALTKAIDYYRALDPEAEDLKIRLTVGELCRARTALLLAGNNAICYHLDLPAELLDKTRYEQLTGTVK